MPKTSIRTKNLSKIYGKKIVVNNISINLPYGGIFGVLGKNGAGKTTFLAMLMGLITPSDGEIFIFDKSLKFYKYEILKKINFQSPYVDLPKKITVMQNLIFYARLYDVKDTKRKILELSEELFIKDLLDNFYGTLSSGQKTRVNLCKALLNDPKLLLLDEPTASLDISTSEFIRKYIISFQKKYNSTILITSHDLEEIEKLCSHIILLENGKIKFDGKKNKLMQQNKSSSLKDIFLKNDK